jgi:hypothetical protein
MRLYVEPQHRLLPGWLMNVIASAGRLNWAVKPEFKTELPEALRKRTNL